MPPDVLMPALSPDMAPGKLTKWLKKEGDAIRAGDIIAEIESGSVTMEVEALDAGVLGRILVPGGTQNVAVNTPVATIISKGEAQLDCAPSPRPLLGEGQRKPANPASHPSAPANSGEKEFPDGTTFATMTVREALRDAIAEEMRVDVDVFVMGEEVAEYQGAHKVTQGLLHEFGPRRVIDTPVTEQGFTGLAIGAAMAGLKPIVEFMNFSFALQAMDQIINSAAKTLYMSGGQMHVPIVFRGPNGAAARGGAQHAHDFAAWFSHVPGLKVVAPYTAADFKGLLKSAIRDPGPVIFLEHEALYGQSFDVPRIDDFLVPIGKARIARAGGHCTLVAFSHGVSLALQAAGGLAEDGIEAEVIDLRTLRPMDSPAIIASVMKTGRCITIEEGWPQSGIGAEISARIMEQAFDYLKAPVMRITGKDVPMPYAANLEKLALPGVSEIVAAVKAVCIR